MLITKLELEELRFAIFRLGNLVYNPESSIFDINGTLTLKTPVVVPAPVGTTAPLFTPVTSVISFKVSVLPSGLMLVTRLNTGSVYPP